MNTHKPVNFEYIIDAYSNELKIQYAIFELLHFLKLKLNIKLYNKRLKNVVLTNFFTQ